MASRREVVRTLFDTNLLVYADSADEPEKQRRAIDLLQQHRSAGQAVLSIQVLQEFTNVALRKLGLPAALVRERLAFYGRFDVVPTTSAILTGALDLHVLHQWSFYDALIVQAALASGCKRVFSEDLHHGGVYAGVRIENPFLP